MAGVAEAEVLEKSANLVLEVPFDLHEQSQADEEGLLTRTSQITKASAPLPKKPSHLAGVPA